MRIVKPSVELLWITPDAEKMIERAGRVAYKSEGQIKPGSAEKFIAKIIGLGHEAVIEHACASMYFVCDRGITHEIVRHRLFSYVQESTRYCNYARDQFGGEIAVVQPPGLGEADEADWRASCEQAERSYLAMVKRGVSPQIARSVLPTCLKTEIVVAGNFREWRHFFKLRTAKAAHPQMQEVAKAALRILVEKCPSVFGMLEQGE
jgi:thymidylate synthase (FAD)